jgi:uracil-DNA glycosylase
MAKRRRESVADLLPDRLSIPTVRAAAQGCRALRSGRSWATVHPSSLLRAPDDETRQHETQRFIQDLRAIAKRL